MVTTVSGAGLGLYNSTQAGVGGTTGALGQGKDGIAVNAATGNLVLQRQDQVLASRGLDATLVGTYNSLGQMDGDNSDGFRYNFAERISGLTGAVNTAGSTITRTNGDGNTTVFTYSSGLYRAAHQGVAGDTLSYDKSTGQWTYVEGDTQVTETYGQAVASGVWRLTSRLSSDGLGIASVSYITGTDLLQTITDSSGGSLALAYTGNNVTTVTTMDGDGHINDIVRYAYDGYNRLTCVTLDLSPSDGDISDGNTYTTTYAYVNNTTSLVASVTQSDGTVASFQYESGSNATSSSRVTQVTIGSGVDAQVTNYVYGTGTTDVQQVMPNGAYAVTTISYDSAGRPLTIVTPPDGNGQRLTTSFIYSGSGNLTRVTDGMGGITRYSYDGKGNRVMMRDARGETTRWVYDGNNHVLEEIHYTGLDTSNSASPGTNNATGPLVTRYVYDAQGRLRFVVKPDGSVTETRYSDSGMGSDWVRTVTEVTYTDNTYPLDNLQLLDSLTESQLMDWVDGYHPASVLADSNGNYTTDLSTTLLKVTTLDFRGQVNSVTTYGRTNMDGSGDGSTASTTYYLYDQFGNLLKSVDARGSDINDTNYVTSYVYDGLGRMTSVTDAGNATVTTAYIDRAAQVVTTQANGNATVAIYNTAGELVSKADISSSTTYSNDFSSGLGNLQSTDAGSFNLNTGSQLVDVYRVKLSGGDTYPSLYDGTTAVYAAGQGYRIEVNAGSDATNRLLSVKLFTNDVAAPGSGYQDYGIRFSGNQIQWVQTTGGTMTTGVLSNSITSNATYVVDIENIDSTTQVAYCYIKGTSRESGLAYVFHKTLTGHTVTWGASTNNSNSLGGSVGSQVGHMTLDNYQTYTLPSRQVYDSLGLLRADIDAVNGTTYYLYDELGRRVGMVDGMGALTEYVYDGDNHVTKTIQYANLVDAGTMAYLAKQVATGDFASTGGQDPLRSVVIGTSSSTIQTQASTDISLVAPVGLAVQPGQSLRLVSGSLYMQGIIGSYDASNGNMIVRVGNNGSDFGNESSSWQLVLGGIRPAMDGANDRVTQDIYNLSGELQYTVDGAGSVTGMTYDGTGRLVSKTAYASGSGSILQGVYGNSYSVGNSNDSNSLTVGSTAVTFTLTNDSVQPSNNYATEFTLADGVNFGVALVGVPVASPDVVSTSYTIKDPDGNTVASGSHSRSQQYPAMVLGNCLTDNPCIDTGLGLTPGVTYTVSYQDYDATNSQPVGSSTVQFTPTSYQPTTISWPKSTAPAGTQSFGIDVTVHSLAAGDVVVHTSDDLSNYGDTLSFQNPLYGATDYRITYYSGTGEAGSVLGVVSGQMNMGFAQNTSATGNQVTPVVTNSNNNNTVLKGYNLPGTILTTVTVPNAITADSIKHFVDEQDPTPEHPTQWVVTVPPGTAVTPGDQVCMYADNANYVTAVVVSVNGNQVTLQATSDGVGSTVTTSTWQLSDTSGISYIDAKVYNAATGELVSSVRTDPAAYDSVKGIGQFATDGCPVNLTSGNMLGAGQYRVVLGTYDGNGALLSEDVVMVSGGAASSSTSQQISNTVKTFTTQAGLPFAVGSRVRLMANSSHYMEGEIISYSGTTMVVSFDASVGTGTYSNWTISSGDDRTTRYYYDDASRLAYVLDPDNYCTQYNYNDAGQLAETVKLANIPTNIPAINLDIVQPDTDIQVTSSSAYSAGSVTQGHTYTFMVPVGMSVSSGTTVRLSTSNGAEYFTGTISSYSGNQISVLASSSGIGTTATNVWQLTFNLATSIGSVSVGSGLVGTTQQFSVSPDLEYAAGQRVRLTANGGTTYIEGTIGSGYTVGSTSMPVVIDTVVGSGSYSNWQLSVPILSRADFANAPTIKTGAITFTTPVGLPFTTGQVVRLSANNGQTYLEGNITSYSGGDSMQVNVTSCGGSGSYTTWDLGMGTASACYASSVSAIQVATGSNKTFTVPSGLGYTTSTRVRLSTDDGSSYMEGYVATYSGTSLTVNVDTAVGSAYSLNWQLTQVVAPPSATSSGIIPNNITNGDSCTFTVPPNFPYILNSTILRFYTNAGTSFVQGTVSGYSNGQLTITVTTHSSDTSVCTTWSVGEANATSVVQSVTPANNDPTIFTIAKNLTGIASGTFVRLESRDGSSYMEGLVSSYFSTTGEIDITVTHSGGSGTADWQLVTPVLSSTSATYTVTSGNPSIDTDISISPPSDQLIYGLPNGTYTAGTRMRFVSSSNSNNWVEGVIKSTTTGTSVTLTIDKTLGSGAFTSYNYYTYVSPKVTDSLALGKTTGTITLTTNTGLPLVAGKRVRLSVNNGATYMEGIIASGGYNSSTGSLTLNCIDTAVGTSGTYSNWELSLTRVIPSAQQVDDISNPPSSITVNFPDTGVSYVPGSRVRLTRLGGASYLEGTVTSATSTTLVVSIDNHSGSGTNASGWILSPCWLAPSVADTLSLATTQSSVTVTTQAGLTFANGQRIRLSINPVTYMEGTVYSYDSSTGSLILSSIDSAVGTSGNYSNWTVSIAPLTKQIGTGTQTFTVPSGMNYPQGSRVRFVAKGTGNYMEGTVTSYSGNAMQVNVDTVSGSGSYSEWDLSPEVTSSVGTSLVFDNSTKYITTQAGLAYTVGDRVRLSTGNGSVYMEGIIQSYVGTSMTINNIDTLVGGTAGQAYSNWQLLSVGSAANATSSNVGAIAPVTGLRVFTLPDNNGLQYQLGDRVRFVSTTDSTLFMEGIIQAQTETSMTVNVDTIGGTGTSSSWQLLLTSSATTMTAINVGTLALNTEKVFTLPVSIAGLYDVGSYVHFVATRSTATLDGTITSIDGTNMTVLLTAKSGTGSWSSWELGLPVTNSSADIHTYSVYDNRGNLVASIDGEGFVTVMSYNVTGMVDTITRYANSINVDTILASISIKAGELTLADLQSFLVTDAGDQTTHYTYNNLNQRETETDPYGTVTTYHYNTEGRLVTTSVAGGGSTRTTGNAYDLQGRLVEEDSGRYADSTDTIGHNTDKVTYAYDAAGRRLAMTDAAGNTTWYYYDADNRLAYTVNALGEVTGMAYDAFGDLVQTTQFVNRLSSVTGLAGGSASDIASLVAGIQDPINDVITQTTYTQRGQVATRSDANTVYLRNKIGTLSEQYLNHSQEFPSQVIQYNAFGEVSALSQAIRDANGLPQYQTTYYLYNKRGLQSQQIVSSNNDIMDASDLVTRTIYDGFRRVVATVSPEGNTVQLGYDRRGLVTTRTDGLDNTTTTGYDAFGRVLTILSPGDTAATTYSYDRANHAYTVTTPQGIATKTILDAYGEVAQVILLNADLNGDGDHTDSGEGNIVLKTYTYDANGNVTSVTDGNGNVSHTSYDARDLVATTTDRNGIVTSFYFDAQKRMTQRIVDSVPGGQNITTNWTYDALGRQVTQEDVSLSMIFGDGSRITQTSYDQDGNVTRILKDPGGLNLLTTYTYDRANHVLTVNEGTITNGVDTFERTTLKTYDAFGHLQSSVVDPSGLQLTTSYTYNKDGKVASVTSPAGVQTFTFYDEDDRVRYVASSVGDGTLLAVTENRYDAQGRLASVVQYANAVSLYDVEDLQQGGAAAAAQADSMANLLTPDTADDRTSYFLYNQDGQVTYSIDSSGLVTHNLYNSQGLVVSRTQFAATLATIAAEVQSTIASITASASALQTALGNTAVTHTGDRVVQTSYDHDGNIASTIDAQNYRTGYTRDAEGNVLQETQESATADVYNSAANGADDHVTLYRYDSLGRLLYTLVRVGTNSYQVTETDTDQWGETTGIRKYAALLSATITATTSTATITSLLEQDNVNDQMMLYGYDNAGRKTLVTQLDISDGMLGAQTTSYDFNSLGMETGSRTYENKMEGLALPPEGDDHVVKNFYDGAGRLVYTLAMTGDVASTQPSATAYVTQDIYDDDGHVVRTVKYATPLANAMGYTATSAVAAAVAGLSSPSDETNDTVYDGSGHIAYSIDGEGYVTGYTYNLFGQVSSETRYPTPFDRSSLDGQLPTVDDMATLDQIEDFANGMIDGFTGVSLNQYSKATQVSNGALHLINANYPSATTPVYPGYKKYLGGASQPVSVYTTLQVGANNSNELGAQVFLDNLSSGSGYRAHGIRIYNGSLQFMSNDGNEWTYTTIGDASVATGTVLQVILTNLGGGDTQVQVFDSNMSLLGESDLSLGSWNAIRLNLRSEVSSTKSQDTLAAGASYLDVDNILIQHGQPGFFTMQTTQYTYDQGGRVVEEDSGIGSLAYNSTGFVYDAFGEATSLIDMRAAIYSSEDTQDAQSWRIANGYAQYAVDLSSSDIQSIANAFTTTQVFDKNGRKLSATDGLGETTATQYDAFGNISTVTDANGNAGYFFYDANNQASYQVDANGYVTQYLRDNFGQVVETRRYNNAVSTSGSLTLSSLQSQLTPFSQNTQIYSGNQPGASVSSGTVTLNSSLSNTNPLQQYPGYITSLGSNVNQTVTMDMSVHDNAGKENTTEIFIDNNLSPNSSSYARLGIKVSGGQLFIESSKGGVWDTTLISSSVTSTPQGQNLAVKTYTVVLSRSANDVSVTVILKSTGAIVGQYDMAIDSWPDTYLKATGYGYDPNDPNNANLIGNAYTTLFNIQSADWTSTWAAYNQLGQKVTTTDALGNTEVTHYDNFGNVSDVTDALGYVTRYTYDQLNRQVTETKTIAQATESTAAVTVMNQQDYDAFGNRTQLVEDVGSTGINRTTGYIYNRNNQLVQTILPLVLQQTCTPATIQAVKVSGADVGVNGFLSQGTTLVYWPTSGSSAFQPQSESISNGWVYFGINLNVAGNFNLTGYVTDINGNILEEISWQYTVSSTGVLTVNQVANAVVYESQLVSPHTYQYYDAFGNLSKQVDGNGNSTYYYYDTQNRQIAMVDAEGYLHEYDRDTVGNLLAERTYNARVNSSFNLDAGMPTSGDLVTNSSDASQDFNASLTRETDYVYDAANRVVAKASSSVYVYGHGSDTNGYQSLVTTQQYDAMGNVTRITQPGGATSYAFYDANGNLQLQVDAGGYATSYVYDANNRVIQKTAYATQLSDTQLASLAGSTAATQSSLYAGLMSELTGSSETLAANNRVTSYAYDGVGNLRFQCVENASVTSFDSSGNRTTSLQDEVTENRYDVLGNLLATIDPNGAETDYSYDGLRRKWKEQDPSFTDSNGNAVRTSTLWTYDNLGNVLSESKLGTNPDVTTDNETTTYTHDAAGNVTSETDANGAVTYYYYDLNGNIVQKLEPHVASTGTGGAIGSVTYATLGYSYDKLNHLTATTDEIGETHTNAYNAFGEIIAQGTVDINGNNVTPVFFVYDNAGRLIDTNQKDGVEHAYLYDGRNNCTADIVQTGDAGGLQLREKTQDQIAQLQNYSAQYDDSGNIIGYISNPLSRTEYGYDLKNNQVATYQPQGGVDETSTSGTSYDWADATQFQHGGVLPQSKISAATTNVTVTNLWNGLYTGHQYSVTVPDTTDLGSGSVALYGNGHSYNGVGTDYLGTVGAAGGTISWSSYVKGDLSSSAYLAKQLPGSYGIWIEIADYSAGMNRTTSFSATIPATVYLTGLPRNVSSINMNLWQGNQFSANDSSGLASVGSLNAPSGYGFTNWTKQTVGQVLDNTGTHVPGMFQMDLSGVADGNYNYCYENVDADNNVQSIVQGTLAIDHDEFGNQTVTITSQKIRQLAPAIIYQDLQAVHSSTQYNAFGQEVAQTDARGNTTNYYYDNSGKLIEQKDPQVNITYQNSSGSVNTTAVTGTPTTDYYYDAAGRTIGTQDANSNQLHSSSGNDYTTVYSGEYYTRNVYDADGHLVQVIDPLENFSVSSSSLSITSSQSNSIASGSSYTFSFAGSNNPYTLNSRVHLVGATGYIEGFVTASSSSSISVQVDTVSGTGLNISSWTMDPGEQYQYDVFGNQAKQTDQLGNVTLYSYDKMNQLVREQLPVDSTFNMSGVTYLSGETTGQRYIDYVYDYQGHRIAQRDARGNWQYNSYDALGRLVQNVDAAGGVTAYGYARNTDGSMTKTTTNANGKVLTDSSDYFGNLLQHIDENGRVFAYTYNEAGWLTHQGETNSIGAMNSSGSYNNAVQDIDYTYYNNGLVETVKDNTLLMESYYEYDENGNRVTEDYVTIDSSGNMTGYVEESTATYDALGRVSQITDPTYTITYSYDSNGNRMHMVTDTNAVAQDYWYLYDKDNRFTVTEGINNNGTVTYGTSNGTTQGYVITYDAAGNRASQAYYNGSTTHVWHEAYSYNAGGLLTVSYVLNGDANSGSGEVYKASRSSYDANGDVLTYTEQNSGSSNVWSTRTTASYANTTLSDTNTYFANSAMATQQQVQGGNTTDTTYHYSSTNALAGPGVGDLYSVVSVTGSTTQTTTYFYDYWDSAKQHAISVKGYYPQESHDWKPGYSYFEYDANGHVVQVKDTQYNNGQGRTLSYMEDQDGRILQRNETIGSSNTPTTTQSYFYFNGEGVGDVGNSGTTPIASHTDYGYELANENPNQKYRVTPATSADFDQNFSPVSSTYPSQTPGSYTINTGDTLDSVARALWGDSSLWYVLADANGLAGTGPSDDLSSMAGTSLVVPNVVTNTHNNSSTFKPYDPNSVMGNTSPTLPHAPPPVQPHHHCGGFLAAIVVIVVIVVACIVAPEILPALTTALGNSALAGAIATGAIAAAAGNVAGQLAGMALGVQDGFSWSQVGHAAIMGAVAGGVGNYLNPTGATLTGWSAVENGVEQSFVSQGIDIALNQQHGMNWAEVAGSGVAAGVSSEVEADMAKPGGTNWTPPEIKFAGTFTGQIASNATQIAINGEGKINWASVAANAAGAAINSSFGQKPSANANTPSKPDPLASVKQQTNDAVGGNASVDDPADVEYLIASTGDGNTVSDVPRLYDQYGRVYSPSHYIDPNTGEDVIVVTWPPRHDTANSPGDVAGTTAAGGESSIPYKEGMMTSAEHDALVFNNDLSAVGLGTNDLWQVPAMQTQVSQQQAIVQQLQATSHQDNELMPAVAETSTEVKDAYEKFKAPFEYVDKLLKSGERAAEEMGNTLALSTVGGFTYVPGAPANIPMRISADIADISNQTFAVIDDVGGMLSKASDMLKPVAKVGNYLSAGSVAFNTVAYANTGDVKYAGEAANTAGWAFSDWAVGSTTVAAVGTVIAATAFTPVALAAVGVVGVGSFYMTYRAEDAFNPNGLEEQTRDNIVTPFLENHLPKIQK